MEKGGCVLVMNLQKLLCYLLLLSAALHMSTAQSCPVVGCTGCGTTTVLCDNAGLTSFPQLPLDVQQTVEILALQGNLLGLLDADVLENYTNLTLLRLDSNQLTELPNGLLNATTELRYLYLFDNQLTKLPEGLLAATTQLQVLRLDNNNLTELPNGLLDATTGLQRLFLQNNQLTEIPNGYLNATTELQYLLLSDNQLTELPVGLLNATTQLQTLWLHSNQLTQLPGGILNATTELVELSLSDNQLTKLPVGLLSATTKLQLLLLYRNQLTELPVGLLNATTQLQTLWLHMNQLTELPDGLLDATAELIQLLLSDNQLTKLPVGLLSATTKLQELWLQSNQLTQLPDGLLNATTELVALLLSENQLTKLPVGFLSATTKLRYLWLHINQLTQLPGGILNATTELVELILFENQLTELPVGLLSATTELQELWLHRNQLTQLPEGFLNATTELVNLLLSENQFTKLPVGLLSATTKLHTLWLHSNQLTQLPQGCFNATTELVNLVLSDNQLTELPVGLLSAMTKLQKLYLESNQFTKLPDGLLNATTELQELLLDNNPLHCDCKLQWLLDFLSTMSVQNATCATPVHLSDIAVVSMTKDQLVCDGCPMETTVVYSYEDETLDIIWPESELGDVIVDNCPCSDLTGSQEEASRTCAQNYTGSVVWQTITLECSEMSDTSIRLCLAARGLAGVGQVSEEVQSITEVEDLEPVDITIVSKILDKIVKSISNATVRDNILSTIDNILDEDRSTIAESQEESNSTSRILHVIDRFGEIVGLEADGKATFSQDNFAIHVDETEVNQYRGITFRVGTDIDTLKAFEDDSITTIAQEEETNRTGAVSISLPDTFLGDLIEDGFFVGVLSSRFSYNVFIDDALFQSLPDSESAAEFRGNEVGSVVVSAAVAGIDKVSDLSKPARMRFQIRQDMQERGRNPRCVFWDTARDDGRGGYSTEGCTMASSTDSDVECECSHLTSFTILLDVSPQEEEEEQLALEIITYIGLGISVIALILTITTYLLSRKLRQSKNGRLLVNMSASLIGLFIVFILSGQAKHYPDGLCGFFSALLHYFMLAYFFWTGVEAIFLYLKLVKVFTGTGVLVRNYVWISMAVAWLVPVIIVGISLAGHEYYTSDNFCRPYKWPFWFGFILPFAVIYIFNWIMFLWIMVSLCRNSAKSAGTTKSTRSVVLRHLLIAVVLSLLFGLGWAFGLIGSSSLPEEVFIPAQYIFSIFVGLQGVLIFIFHAIRSPDAREEWKRWWYTVTCRAEQYRVQLIISTSGTIRRNKNASAKRQTSATSPTDSFRLASSSTTKKVPLSPESDKHANIPLSSTSIVLDTFVEMPETTGDEEKGDLGKGVMSTGPEEGKEEKTTM